MSLQVREFFDFRHDHEPFRLEATALRHFPLLSFTNGAGDFTLLSREGWWKLGAYLENDCRNHVDSWFCYHAAKRGFAQVILPVRMCVYHQDHEKAALLPFEETMRTLSKLSPNVKWGLAGEALEEEVVQEGSGTEAEEMAA
jgi:hypothetical protein